MFTRIASTAVVAITLLLLLAAPAGAASVDLAVTDGDIGPGTKATGELNTALFFLRNRSSKAVDVTLELTTNDRLAALGLQNWDDAGTPMADLDCADPVASGTSSVLTCTTRIRARWTTTVAAILGAAKPGTARVSLAAAPVANTDPSPGNARQTVTGKQTGPSCTVLGTNGWVAGGGSETLTGTEGDDVLCGFGGHERCTVVQGDTPPKCTGYFADEINGLGGNDTVLLTGVDVMGEGRGDSVDLGTGTDTIRNVDRVYPAVAKLGTIATLAHTFRGKTQSRHRIAGAERYVGGPLADRVTGSSGNDEILGGSGDDTLRGGAGDDRLLGGAGDDVLLGDTGSDTLGGGHGYDVAGVGEDVGATIDAKQRTMVASGTDTYSSAEAVRGSAGADTFTGTSDDDRFITGGGADTATGGGGTDDVIEFTAVGGKGVQADMQAGTAKVGTQSLTFTGFERVLGTQLADRIFGSSRGDTIEGEGGDDVLSGRAGYDLLIGGAGNDTLLGGAGPDSLYGGFGRDILRGDAGSDSCFQDGNRVSVMC